MNFIWDLDYLLMLYSSQEISYFLDKNYNKKYKFMQKKLESNSKSSYQNPNRSINGKNVIQNGSYFSRNLTQSRKGPPQNTPGKNVQKV